MKNNLKSLILLIATIGIMSFLSSACQTIDGIGRDVENLGDSMQN